MTSLILHEVSFELQVMTEIRSNSCPCRKWLLYFLAIVWASAASADNAVQPLVTETGSEATIANELDKDQKIFAVVGEETISMEEFLSRLDAGRQNRFFHGQISPEKAREFAEDVAEQLIDKVLLRQEAQRRGLQPDDAWVESRIRQAEARYSNLPEWQERGDALLATLRKQLEDDSLVMVLEALIKEVPEPGHKEIKQYYEEHAEKFTTPERLRISVIMLKVEPWATADTWQAANDEALRLIKNLRNRDADFSELARLHSSDPSAEKGGDLGYVHKGMLAEEAQKVLDTMSAGEISEPVMLLQGIAIMRLDERTEPMLNDFSSAQQRARDLLLREKKERAWQALLHKLRSTTPIKRKDTMVN